MNKLLKTSKPVLFIITAALIIGCGKDSSNDYAARVNKSYLSKSELDSLTSNNGYKGEFVRNWIDDELLYQEAAKNGILDSDAFKKIIEKSSRELAASMMLKRIYDNSGIKINLSDIQQYYNEHIDEFKAEDDCYQLNILQTSEEGAAYKFRNALFESNWDQASGSLLKGLNGAFEQRNITKLKSEIHPASLMRLINELLPGEVTIVINDSNNSFYIAQLINKFPKGTILPFEVIKQDAENMCLSERKSRYIRKYLDELYMKNDIEIRTGKK